MDSSHKEEFITVIRRAKWKKPPVSKSAASRDGGEIAAVKGRGPPRTQAVILEMPSGKLYAMPVREVKDTVRQE